MHNRYQLHHPHLQLQGRQQVFQYTYLDMQDTWGNAITSKVNADIKAEVFAAISILPIDTLSMLSMSGPMSKAVGRLLRKLQGFSVSYPSYKRALKMATLGGHYIGQHIVKRIFETISVKTRKKY